MIPNIHIHEKLMFERHQELLREFEQRRVVASLRRQHFSRVRHMVARVGALLVVLGTSLKRLEPGAKQVVHNL